MYSERCTGENDGDQMAALEQRQADHSEQLMVAHIRRVAVYVAGCAKALRAKDPLDK